MDRLASTIRLAVFIAVAFSGGEGELHAETVSETVRVGPLARGEILYVAMFITGKAVDIPFHTIGNKELDTGQRTQFSLSELCAFSV